MLLVIVTALFKNTEVVKMQKIDDQLSAIYQEQIEGEITIIDSRWKQTNQTKRRALTNLPNFTEEEAMNFIFLVESSRNFAAVNPSSLACGAGQALPCSKLSNVCPNWANDPECQIEFFTNYVKNRYGGWNEAVAFWNTHGWY
jgi:kynurenine formamidase